MPRIAYVLKRYPRYSETFVVNEILAHEAAGLDIRIYSLRPPGDTHFQDIISQVRAPVTYLPFHGINTLNFWQAFQESGKALPDFWEKMNAAKGVDHKDMLQAVLLAKLAKQEGITHFHAHFATSATTVARLAGYFADIPYTFTAHAKDIFHNSVCPLDLEQKITDAEGVVTVSDFNVSYLKMTYGAASEKVQRIYNGLQLKKFQYSSPAERPPRIVAVGRMVEKKEFSVLIDACRILSKRGIDFQCHIVGSGELEHSLREQIAALNLREEVRIMGPLPQKEVIDHIQSAAVFAAPFIIGEDGNRDGLPTTLLEAMALGTPCVSTDVTGIPEILKDGKTGLMVPQHQAKPLADAIEVLLSSPSERVRLAKAARLLIEQHFQIDQNTLVQRGLFQSSAQGAAAVCRVAG